MKPGSLINQTTGETLAERLERERRLDPPVAAWIARDVALALAAAHARNAIHRNMRPANIFLHQEPYLDRLVIDVLDLGTGYLDGSLPYMSPEQVSMKRDIDHRSDLWSLGVVLFEMLTGVLPFKGDAAQIILQIVTGEIPLVSRYIRHVDPALVTLVARCLERDRERRIASASALASDLERFADMAASPDVSTLPLPVLDLAREALRAVPRLSDVAPARSGGHQRMVLAKEPLEREASCTVTTRMSPRRSSVLPASMPLPARR